MLIHEKKDELTLPQDPLDGPSLIKRGKKKRCFVNVFPLCFIRRILWIREGASRSEGGEFE